MKKMTLTELVKMCRAVDANPDDAVLVRRFESELEKMTPKEILLVLVEVKRLAGEPPPLVFCQHDRR